ncbi:tRNA (guanosine(37)-N1)-methyltransferase TrmD, partial [Mycoplasmopsis synoviae]
GGHGLLLQVEPIDLALDSLENRGGYKILVTPQGKIFVQKMANKLAKYDQITLISGRYEGFDERVTYLVDEEISIGEYVLTRGGLPAMIIADSICHLVPGVIKKKSVE